ncbi:MAG: ribonuclease HII [Chitinophagales bacterium]|nr:ribonuclease HII [Chitinophagales bacterium]MDW8417998.1 ribonuclease HII [Chitinophagales bacterium]
MLSPCYQHAYPEAGCDEAGRGSLAGPVFAAAVILPPGFHHPQLTDSKKLTANQRSELRRIIEREAADYAVAMVDEAQIDALNILNASLLAMHRALDRLRLNFGFIAVDGNRFIPYKNIPYKTLVKGDSKYLNIAAASILAKTYRDEYMIQLHDEFPHYNWLHNKGYATREHRRAINTYGRCKYHRKSFILKEQQLTLW